MFTAAQRFRWSMYFYLVGMAQGALLMWLCLHT